MTIPYHCPHCGVFTEVEDRFAGQKGDCATCGKPIEVPPAATSSTVGPKFTRETNSATTSTATAILVFACGGIVLFLMFLGLGAFFFFQMPTPAMPPMPVVATAPTTTTNQSTGAIRCTSNLQQIYAAIQLYEQANGSLPPPYLTDAAGKPAHSWRVLLLPYLGSKEKALFDKYDFEQAWDSPANATVREQIPSIYQCPSSGPNGTNTNYIVVVGEETAFYGNTGRRRADINDNLNETILVAEVPASSLDWLSPNDPTIDNLSFDSGNNLDPGSDHPEEGAHVLYASGTVERLSEYTTDEEFKAALTVAGGD